MLPHFEAWIFELLTKYFDWLITTSFWSRAAAKETAIWLASLPDYSESRNLEAWLYYFKNLKASKIYKETFRKVKGEATLFFHPENWKSCFLFQIQQKKSSAGETLSFCVMTQLLDKYIASRKINA